MPPEKFESPSRSMTPTQHAAIKKSRELCSLILNHQPDIAQLVVQDYRCGLSYRAIAIKYNLDRNHNVSIGVAITSVHNIIKTLIDNGEERAKIALDHKRQSGLNAREQRKGVHGLSMSKRKANGLLSLTSFTPEEKSAFGRKGGTSNVINKTGFYSISKMELSRATKMGRLKNGIGAPWDILIDSETGLNEGEYCYSLSQGPLIGSMKEKTILIARILNEKFHSGKLVRTDVGVYLRIRKIKATRAA